MAQARHRVCFIKPRASRRASRDRSICVKSAFAAESASPLPPLCHRHYPQLSPDAAVPPLHHRGFHDRHAPSPQSHPEHGQKRLCMIEHRHLPSNAIIAGLRRLHRILTEAHTVTAATTYEVVVSETLDPFQSDPLQRMTCFQPAVSSSAYRPASYHIDRSGAVKICDT